MAARVPPTWRLSRWRRTVPARFSQARNGLPSHDTFSCLFRLLDPELSSARETPAQIALVCSVAEANIASAAESASFDLAPPGSSMISEPGGPLDHPVEMRRTRVFRPHDMPKETGIKQSSLGPGC